MNFVPMCVDVWLYVMRKNCYSTLFWYPISLCYFLIKMADLLSLIFSYLYYITLYKHPLDTFYWHLIGMWLVMVNATTIATKCNNENVCFICYPMNNIKHIIDIYWKISSVHKQIYLKWPPLCAICKIVVVDYASVQVIGPPVSGLLLPFGKYWHFRILSILVK